MTGTFSKKDSFWIPERTFGVCIWVMPNGEPLSDGEGVLSAEGFVGDENIEKAVKEAAAYWTGSTEGRAEWIHGARKVTSSERDDQVERLSSGLVADPYEDFLRGYN